jgi:hypothetical protein
MAPLLALPLKGPDPRHDQVRRGQRAGVLGAAWPLGGSPAPVPASPEARRPAARRAALRARARAAPPPAACGPRRPHHTLPPFPQVCRIVQGQEELAFDFSAPAYDEAAAWPSLYQAPAREHRRWGPEGACPFFVRGVINVGYRPHDRDFIYKVGGGGGGPGGGRAAAAVPPRRVWRAVCRAARAAPAPSLSATRQDAAAPAPLPSRAAPQPCVLTLFNTPSLQKQTQVCYYGFEYDGYETVLSNCNPECRVEFCALLRTITLAKETFPLFFKNFAAETARHLARRGGGGGGGGAPGPPAREGSNTTVWMLPRAGGHHGELSKWERQLMRHRGWAEPPGEACRRYLAALEGAVRELHRDGKRLK